MYFVLKILWILFVPQNEKNSFNFFWQLSSNKKIESSQQQFFCRKEWLKILWKFLFDVWLGDEMNLYCCKYLDLLIKILRSSKEAYTGCRQ